MRYTSVYANFHHIPEDPMIKYIIFDLGNVLIHIHPHEVIAEFTRRCQLPREKIQQFYLSDLHMAFMEGRYSGDEFYRQMMKEYPCRLSLPEFITIWNGVIGGPKEGIPELIRELKHRYTLAVCSNTDTWHWQKVLRTIDFMQDFSHYFLSFELKHGKPDPEVYRHMLKKLGVQGEDCLFIDDTSKNIEAGSRFGIQGIAASEPQDIISLLKIRKLLP